MRSKLCRGHSVSRSTVCVALALLAGGCSDATSPRRLDQAGRPALVDDRTGTAKGFYFLPPISTSDGYSGQFDPDRQPTVQVCRLNSSLTCQTTTATFTMQSTGAAAVTRDVLAEHYLAVWSTLQPKAAAGESYRVRVLEGDVELGHADVRVIRSASDAKSVPRGYVPLVVGQALPIKFRLEMPVLGDPVSGTIGDQGGVLAAVVMTGSSFRLDVPPGALTSPVNFTVTPQPPGNGKIATVVITPSDIVFRKPVTLTFSLPPQGASAAGPLTLAMTTPGGTEVFLPVVVAASEVKGTTPLLGAPSLGPPFPTAPSAFRLHANVAPNDAGTSVSVSEADIQGMIDALNARAAELEAQRSFESAVEFRLHAAALAQLAGNYAAADAALQAVAGQLCTLLQTDYDLAMTRLGSEFRNLWEAMRPILSVYASYDLVGATDCPAYLGLDAAANGLINAFLPLAEVAMAVPTFASNVEAVAMKLYESVFYRQNAQLLGIEPLWDATIVPRLQKPLAALYRRASYNWCRNDVEQHYLGYLFRSLRDDKLYYPGALDSQGLAFDADTEIGIPPGHVWNDAQFCGTDVVVTSRDPSGPAQQYGPLGGLTEPGQTNVAATIPVHPGGTVELTGKLIALRCRNEEVGNDRILVRFNNQFVRHLDRVVPTAHFIRVTPVTFDVDALAETGAINVAQGGTYALELLREGNECNGEYHLAATPPPNVLLTLNLVFPPVAVDVIPGDTIFLEKLEQNPFQAQVTGTSNTAVTWELRAGQGTFVDIQGNHALYQAPDNPDSTWVIARSVAAPSVADSALALVKVAPCEPPDPLCTPVSLEVTPASATLQVGGTQTFSATVTGTQNQAVTWTATGGTIDALGNYTAGSTPGDFVVTATSVEAPNATDMAQVTILPPPQVTYTGTTTYASVLSTVTVDRTSSGLKTSEEQLPASSTSGALHKTAMAGPITSADGSAFGQGTAESKVQMQMNVANGVLLGGSATGSVTSAATATSSGTLTANARATSLVRFAITFSVPAPVVMRLSASGSMTGACGSNESLFVEYGRAGAGNSIGATSHSIDTDFVLAAGDNVLSVGGICTVNPHNGVNGVPGSFTGGLNFNVTFHFKPAGG